MRNSAHSENTLTWSVSWWKSGHIFVLCYFWTRKHISNRISTFSFPLSFLLFKTQAEGIAEKCYLQPLVQVVGGQRWSEVKVQDVSHRTGQRGGTRVGGGHREAQRNGGREGEKQGSQTKINEIWWERRKGAATGEDVGKGQKDKGGFGRTWKEMAPREAKKAEEKIVRRKRQFPGSWGQRGWVNSSKKPKQKRKRKKKQNQTKKGMNPYLGRLTSGAPDLEREKTEKKNRKRKKRRS